ncbi:hypothetical protein [Paracoccus aminophilus]|uniref:DUF2946 domain-containing protein n=1 Tax=Paracoccus aminophilus JCM 7686 TaxID=1367847 RepID=S5Y150_PARAH|nr:hypothetical protein [Paracoccus aminophilus]AGT11222.1 hypothetical protein JCM7686_pAMI5p156 [Paracoccus aminophilus JCM 7686]
MLWTGPLRPLCLALIALVALALGAVGGAHRVPSLESLQLQAYSAQGLSVDLCGHGDDQAPAIQGCPVCTLVGQAVLPPQGESLIAHERRFYRVTYLPEAEQAAHRPRDPANLQRGPPLPA